MLISCPSCQAGYEVPEHLLTGGAQILRCSWCRHEWVVSVPPPGHDEPDHDSTAQADAENGEPGAGAPGKGEAGTGEPGNGEPAQSEVAQGEVAQGEVAQGEVAEGEVAEGEVAEVMARLAEVLAASDDETQTNAGSDPIDYPAALPDHADAFLQFPPPLAAANAVSQPHTARAPGALVAAWLMTMLLLGSLSFGVLYWRDTVMAAWPPSQRAYRLFGLG